jgi:uncharacterized protein (DUF1778 family)
MSNTAIISFKVAPDQYAVLKAMASSQHKSLSQFVRETVEQALDLESQARLLASFFARAAEDPEYLGQV